MKYETLCRLHRMTDKIEETLVVVAALVAGVYYFPVYLSMRLYEWLQEKRNDYIINKYAILPDEAETLTRDEVRTLIEQGKIRIYNLPHSRKKYDKRFNINLYPFHSERKLIPGRTTIAYVENRYCHRMHQFFEEQAQWIKEFEQWHGVHIAFVDNEELKEGMFFPQDLDNCMNHGFLWNQNTRISEPEYDFWCINHHYIEIDPSSDEDIKKQMHVFMSKVHDRFI